jgi:hypothetical protein
MPMKTVKTHMDYSEESGRIEMLIRIIYSFVLLVVFGILYSTVLPVLWVIQAAYILILGKRNETIHRLLKTVVLYGSRTNYYAFLLIDEKPPLIPEIEEK